MKINYYTEDCEYKLKDKRKISNTLKYLITNENYSLGDINVIICSDKYLLEINNKYLNHNYYTDVITFDYREENIVSGDLFISYQTVEDNAAQFDQTPVNEMIRVIIHGVLHLCGYKDKSEGEAIVMRQKENEYLEYFAQI